MMLETQADLEAFEILERMFSNCAAKFGLNVVVCAGSYVAFNASMQVADKNMQTYALAFVLAQAMMHAQDAGIPADELGRQTGIIQNEMEAAMHAQKAGLH